MRNIIIILIIGLTAFWSTSCEEMYGDYLEKAPGVDITEDSLFVSQAQSLLFLASCYEQAMQSPLPYSVYRQGSAVLENNIYGGAYTVNATYSDEALHQATWWVSTAIVTGSMNSPNNVYDRFYVRRWTALRMLHTMLERIDDVPDADDNYKTTVKAEMRFLRAILYFEMFRRYGGVPIVERRFAADELDAMKVPRSTVDETVKFIIQDLDYAAGILPDAWPSNWKGRVTKGAALALKSKTLLYAASPLFNTATPILSMDDPANNNLIVYGNYDVNRWQQAADAAKAVIDWAPSGGVRLITEFGPDKSYRHVWEKPDNAEIILADKQINGFTKKINHWMYMLPRELGGTQGLLASHQYVAYAYDKRDGTPMEWGASGDNLADIYAQLDYRFHQTIGYNGGFWNTQRGNLALFLAPPAPAGAHSANNKTGYFVKKNIPDEVNGSASRHPYNWIWFRLGEYYLNYAEALNEAQGPVQAAYDAVNIIRSRSGMPNLPTGLTKEQFRERVRKERAVELAFEDHRWYDIKRWLIAGNEGIGSGDILGKKIYKMTPVTTPLTFRYETYVVLRRTWYDRFYLHPFEQTEINMGHIVQNPGW